jgi:hypothetical protein
LLLNGLRNDYLAFSQQLLIDYRNSKLDKLGSRSTKLGIQLNHLRVPAIKHLVVQLMVVDTVWRIPALLELACDSVKRAIQDGDACEPFVQNPRPEIV